MRRAGFKRETTEKLIRRAAVQMIAQHGFRAASLRKVADEVGIQAGSLYNYIKSKDDFLFNLLREHLELMLGDLERASSKTSGVVERLKKLIELHIRFHTEQKEEVIIGNLELRSLSAKHRKIITDLRDRYSSILTDLIKEGVKKKLFKAEDPRVATFAILSMLSGVASWYNDDGRLSQANIVDLHMRMTFRLLGVDEVPQDRPHPGPPRAARAKSEAV
ncbi:TetR/AcrR family transcriptional regulator [Bradyrhizobium sp. 1]|uniref:TetR/AcrR family transcriptional regulator n=1 Tax=Bradyrhizobium sp. 1 TaxID=241591 RepID=UPI001FFA7561|nr:TetR/AcrR family transcriptional regulator [Bradyrhizobium sp. 1]MCK1394442.1 TetR family transcriptional regulator [Bradyrhizobium sp. 1]